VKVIVMSYASPRLSRFAYAAMLFASVSTLQSAQTWAQSPGNTTALRSAGTTTTDSQPGSSDPASNGDNQESASTPQTSQEFLFDLLATADVADALGLWPWQRGMVHLEVSIRSSEVAEAAMESSPQQQEVVDFWQFLEPLLANFLLDNEQFQQLMQMSSGDGQASPTNPDNGGTPSANCPAASGSSASVSGSTQ